MNQPNWPIKEKKLVYVNNTTRISFEWINVEGILYI